MRKITRLFLTAAAVVMMSVAFGPSAKAQTPSSHVFHVNTWYMAGQLDSTGRAERNALLKEYHQKVTMKNDLVLHTTVMVHFFSEDSREFVTVTEYASLSDIEKAYNRDQELEKQAWPDQKQRADFMKKMNSYFTYHKDAIFSGMPSLMK